MSFKSDRKGYRVCNKEGGSDSILPSCDVDSEIRIRTVDKTYTLVILTEQVSRSILLKRLAEQAINLIDTITKENKFLVKTLPCSFTTLQEPVSHQARLARDLSRASQSPASRGHRN
ncbi:hypothetical protein ElyMa_006958500 [Elysia marginata]|uniref:Uncharacterized protein n=1 Tax=Elysia marginata TaxID=1093978 RepID=A0AAV4JQ56_9GAST|nr:hypothetical protein ElyMa_006958500 [Elysia marginata]